MTDTQNSFEAPNLPEHHAEEVKSIGQEAEARGVEYAEQGVEKERKEVFKEVLGERHSEQTQPTTQTDEDDLSDAERIKAGKKTEKLNEVMRYASERGPIKASLLVRKIGDPWLEDKFHDELIRLHDELVERNQLNKG